MVRFALPFFLAAWPCWASADTPTIPSRQLAQPPTIDGHVTDTEWSGAATFEGLFDTYTGQIAPKEQSAKFWLASDSKYIYFAARLSDSSPRNIQATEYRTNTSMPGDDAVALRIDLSGSLNDFCVFQANPRGATSIELPGGRAAKREWVGEFLAQGSTTDAGWEVEMRIPWAILPLPKEGKRDLRFNVERFIPRLNRDFSYTFINEGRSANTPIWQGVLLPKPSVDRSIRLLPYAYGGVDRKDGVIANAGLDLKTSLSDQVQLVGTINPDFRNVENAILSLDFSRFARIADETRPFFQEGAGYLESGIYASQRIQRLDAGVNVYGKLGDRTQFGVLNAVDFGHENSLVANGTYAPDPVTSYRVTFTDHSTPGSENSAYMARVSRDFGAWNLFLRTENSQDSAVGHGSEDALQLSYAKAGVYGSMGTIRRAKNFDPALGFVPETDFQGANASLGYERSAAHGPFQTVGGHIGGLTYDRTSGRNYRGDFNFSGYLVTRAGLLADFIVDRPTFEGSKDRIDTYELAYPQNDPYRNVSLGYTHGEISSEPYRLVSAQANYRMFRRFQLSASYQRYHLGDFETDQEIIGGNYDLGNDRSISGRVVSSHGKTNFYVALRRAGNRGAEYYLIFGDPNALTFRSSLILKLVVPFKVS